MALDATVGGSSSNSYVTVAEADAYFHDRLFARDWDLYEFQEALLITASRQLDWYIKWKGKKATEAQAMQWPRTDVLRSDGTEVASTIIPADVKWAVYELALSSLTEDRTKESDLAGIEQLKAGSLMLKTDGGGVDSTAKKTIPEKVWKILSDLISRSTIGVVRLMRA